MYVCAYKYMSLSVGVYLYLYMHVGACLYHYICIFLYLSMCVCRHHPMHCLVQGECWQILIIASARLLRKVWACSGWLQRQIWKVDVLGGTFNLFLFVYFFSFASIFPFLSLHFTSRLFIFLPHPFSFVNRKEVYWPQACTVAQLSLWWTELHAQSWGLWNSYRIGFTTHQRKLAVCGHSHLMFVTLETRAELFQKPTSHLTPLWLYPWITAVELACSGGSYVLAVMMRCSSGDGGCINCFQIVFSHVFVNSNAKVMGRDAKQGCRWRSRLDPEWGRLIAVRTARVGGNDARNLFRNACPPCNCSYNCWVLQSKLL